MRKRALLAAVTASVLILAGCDDQPSVPQQDPAAKVTTDPKADEDATRALLEAIRTPPTEGGELEAAPETLTIEIFEGGQGSARTRVSNIGDETVTLESVETLSSTNDMVYRADNCADGTVLEPGQSCRFYLGYRDDRGSDLETALVILSDARKTPRLKIPIVIDVEPRPEPAPTPEPKPEPEPAPEPQPEPQPRPAPQQPPVAQQPAFPVHQLATAHAARNGSGFGRAYARADRVTVDSDPRYPKDDFPWTTSTLPVDRSRILTSDRIIKAVIERPFSNIACDRVTAQVEMDVYSPDSANILIPRGTRFIGTCGDFNDRRATVTWTRFITPNGVSAKIQSSSADESGRHGIPGHLDRRVMDRFVYPLAFSALKAATTWFLADDDETTTNGETGERTTTQTNESKAVEQFQNDAERTAGEFVKDFTNTKQVLSIPRGTRIDILLSEDVYFKSPREVVRLDDVEYEIQRDEERRVVTPANDPRAFRGAHPYEEPGRYIEINGKRYRLVEEGDQGSSRRGGQSGAGGGQVGAGDVYRGPPAAEQLMTR